MTTEITQDSKPSYGVTFSKKVSDGNYGGEEVSFWVSADVPAGADMKTILGALAEAAFVAKASAFEQLGIEFEDKGGVLFAVNKAKVERHFGPTTVVDTPVSDDPAKPNYVETGVQGDGYGGNAPRVKGTQHGELPTWLLEACVRDGVTEVWDNRDKVAGTKRPHFSDTKKDAAGKTKGYWPPSKP